MIVKQDRADLDSLLKDPKATILLVCGAEGSDAAKVESWCEDNVSEPWRHCCLITDSSVMTTDERAWFDGGPEDRYACVGGDTRGTQGTKPKKVADSGKVASLLFDGSPDSLEISNVLAKGDQV